MPPTPAHCPGLASLQAAFHRQTEARPSPTSSRSSFFPLTSLQTSPWPSARYSDALPRKAGTDRPGEFSETNTVGEQPECPDTLCWLTWMFPISPFNIIFNVLSCLHVEGTKPAVQAPYLLFLSSPPTAPVPPSELRGQSTQDTVRTSPGLSIGGVWRGCPGRG